MGVRLDMSLHCGRISAFWGYPTLSHIQVHVCA